MASIGVYKAMVSLVWSVVAMAAVIGILAAVFLSHSAVVQGADGTSPEPPLSTAEPLPITAEPQPSTAKPQPFSPPAPLGLSFSATQIDLVCSQIATTFNSINKALPMIFEFEAGNFSEIQYPAGQIILNSEARQLNGCITYNIPGKNARIVRLKVAENFTIEFPKYNVSGTETNVNLNFQSAEVQVHYELRQSENGVLNLKPVLGELRSLGRVSLVSGLSSLNGTEFSEPAEDLVRPVLAGPFDQFVRKELSWTVVPGPAGRTRDALDSFRVIFKRLMLDLKPSQG